MRVEGILVGVGYPHSGRTRSTIVSSATSTVGCASTAPTRLAASVDSSTLYFIIQMLYFRTIKETGLWQPITP